MGCFGGGGAKVDTSSSKAAASLTSSQWADFQQRYAPLENKLMGYTNSGTSVINSDGSVTNSGDTSYNNQGDIDAWKKKRDELNARYKSLANQNHGGKKHKKRRRKAWDELKAWEKKKPGFQQVTNNNTLAGQLKHADTITAKQFKAGLGNMQRSAARYGGMTPEQQAEAERLNKLDASKTRMTMRNGIRDNTRDSDLNLSAAMMGIGKNITQNVNANAAASAAVEQQNNAFNMQQSLNSKNNMLSNVGTLAGAAAMLFL